MNKIKIEENKNIYEDDIINNYKRYYINNLNLMKESISLGNINLINLIPPQINPPNSSNIIIIIIFYVNMILEKKMNQLK